MPRRLPARRSADFLSQLCCCFERRKKTGGNEDGEEDAGESWDLFFDYKTLQIATNFFSDLNLLGHGGFGPVFKGLLPNGQEIAVKKLSLSSRQGHREFANEVKLLLKIQHKNLVTLLGCCAEASEMMLVYEYLPNKSLDSFLFDKRKSGSLDWSKRKEIITGVARGLLYLHEEAPERIIHRDIKASNILLDEQLKPKISDFGLARLFPGEDTHLNTFRISGTHGYMAPEYAMRGFLSVKSDVFSFGILLLEIVGGRKNNDRHLDVKRADLLSYAWNLFQQGEQLKLVDPTLGEFNEEEAVMYIQLGLLCCQATVANRPDMNSIHLMLLSDSFTMPKPGKPGIQGRVGRWTTTTGTTTGSTSAFTKTNATSSTAATAATVAGAKASSNSSLEYSLSRNSISVSFVDEGR